MKIKYTALRHIFGLGVFLCLFDTSSVYAWSWQDLWVTKNRQAQILMKQGQFVKAKDMFERDDWRAAAAYRAGDYQGAATLYQGLNNTEADYNQGNAQAYLRQYEKAIQAYDKVLAKNPHHHDAVHNRKIVENLLKKEKQDRQKQSQQDKQNQDQQSQDKQNQEQGHQGQQRQDKQNQEQGNQGQQNQESGNQSQNDQEKQNREPEHPGQKTQDKQDQLQNTNKQNNSDKDPLKSDEQDKALNKDAKAQNSQEKQMKEQWLRLIPDDPGGFLREKFLRDYLQKQHEWYP